MSKLNVGRTLKCYLPWMPGLRDVRIVARRVPVEGEYIMDNGGQTFKASGRQYISDADRKREYWILREIEP